MAARKFDLFLVRIYDDLEPSVVCGPLHNSKDYNRAVVRHLRTNPYDDGDGMFTLSVDHDGVDMFSFAKAHMDRLRKLARPARRRKRS